MKSVDKHVCYACNKKTESKEICDLCRSIVGNTLGEKWNVILTQSEHEEGIELFGGRGGTSRTRWSRLKANVSATPDVNWARLRDHEDPIRALPCSLIKLKEIIDLISEGRQLQHDERRILQVGFTLHDGKLLSFLQEKAILDGRKLPQSVPVASLLKLICDEKNRIGWNLSKLIMAMGSLEHGASNLREQEYFAHTQNNARMNRLANRRALRNDADARINSRKRPLVAMLNWLQIEAEDRLFSGDSNGNHPLSAWARDVRFRIHLSGSSGFSKAVSEGFAHHPKGCLDLISAPWFTRWLEHKQTTRLLSLKDWPLKLSRNKWQLRVRTKAGNSRLANIPEDPAIWAYLISAVLSPLESQIGLNLLALQSNWTASHDEVVVISPPLQRSIEFLNQIISANPNNVFVESNRILIIGRLGHFHELRVGKGAHGAPFIIEAIRSLNPKITHPLCIHHGTFHSQVPLGDTIASAVLSLIDDVKLAARVDSIMREITTNSPFGFNNILSDKEKPFINAVALKQLRQQVRNSPQNYRFYIQWDGQEDATNRGQERMNLAQQNHRDNNLRFILERHWQIEENAHHGHNLERSERLKHVNSTLQAIKMGRAPPIEKFVQQWRQDVSMNQSNEEARFDRIINPPYGNNWMFLRNHGMRHQNEHIGDIRNGERRWCELMPRAWQAMQLQPIGSIITVGGEYRQEISFEHCNLKVTLRSALERRTVIRFAQLMGYVENGTTDGSTVFVRRDHPQPNHRRLMTRIVENLQQRFGARGAPPWWWHYAEAEQAPEQAPEFAWELEEDLRDEGYLQRE